MGSSARRSFWTKSPSRSTPPARGASVCRAAQPALPASTRPSTTPVMPSVEVTAPGRSKRPCLVAVSLSTTHPSASTASPIGTFTNITQRQLAHSVSTPPETRPMAPPAADTVVNKAIARILAAPSGKIEVRRASEDGAASAAPTPCRARPASSIHGAAASPPTSELAENREIPIRNVRRRPIRSPERAPSRSRPPKVRT